MEISKDGSIDSLVSDLLFLTAALAPILEQESPIMLKLGAMAETIDTLKNQLETLELHSAKIHALNRQLVQERDELREQLDNF